MMAVIVEIQRFDALMQRVRRIHTGAEQVRERTLQDAKQRVPGWVATEITKQYGIKKVRSLVKRSGQYEYKPIHRE